MGGIRKCGRFSETVDPLNSTLFERGLSSADRTVPGGLWERRSRIEYRVGLPAQGRGAPVKKKGFTCVEGNRVSQHRAGWRMVFRNRRKKEKRAPKEGVCSQPLARKKERGRENSWRDKITSRVMACPDQRELEERESDKETKESREET